MLHLAQLFPPVGAWSGGERHLAHLEGKTFAGTGYLEIRFNQSRINPVLVFTRLAAKLTIE